MIEKRIKTVPATLAGQDNEHNICEVHGACNGCQHIGPNEIMFVWREFEGGGVSNVIANSISFPKNMVSEIPNKLYLLYLMMLSLELYGIEGDGGGSNRKDVFSNTLRNNLLTHKAFKE